MKKVIVIGNSTHWREIQDIQRDLTLSRYMVFGVNLLGPRELFSDKQLKNVDDIMYEQLNCSDIVYVHKPKYCKLDGNVLALLRQARNWGKIILINGKLELHQDQ